MTRKMTFKHPKALKQLLEKGIVATMRNYFLPPLTKVKANNKYDCIVLGSTTATEENIKKLHDISGFGSPEEWLKEAIKIHRGKTPKYIIVVAKLDSTSEKLKNS